jgi:hypothetical protein
LKSMQHLNKRFVLTTTRLVQLCHCRLARLKTLKQGSGELGATTLYLFPYSEGLTYSAQAAVPLAPGDFTASSRTIRLLRLHNQARVTPVILLAKTPCYSRSKGALSDEGVASKAGHRTICSSTCNVIRSVCVQDALLFMLRALSLSAFQLHRATSAPHRVTDLSTATPPSISR